MQADRSGDGQIDRDVAAGRLGIGTQLVRAFDANVVIVSCTAPQAEADTTVPGAVVEPELIRKAKEEGAEEK